MADIRKITAEMVKNATPLELTIINYELLLRAIDNEDLPRAKDCVAVLYESLNFDVEFSHDLAGLYVFMNVALNRAGFAEGSKKDEALAAAKGVAAGLLEAWQSIDPADIQKHINATTGRVAGLTYGAGGELTEFDDYDPDGGYKI